MATKPETKATETKTETTPAPKANPCEGCHLKPRCKGGWIWWNGSEYPCSDR